MVGSMGQEAMNGILDVSALMKAIAKRWDFEPGVLGDLTAHLEAEVQGLLESTPLPGQPVNDVVNAGYVVTQAVLFENDRGFALAHSPTAPNSFVTWQLTNDTDSGTIDYYWGRYRNTEVNAQIDYVVRATEYQSQYGLKEKPLPLAAFEQSKAKTAEIQAESKVDPNPIHVQVTTETQPLVTVTFSECDQLRGITKMPLHLANTAFFDADEQQQKVFVAAGHEGHPSLKTDFRIDFIKDGNPESYTGRYDVGDGDGTLTEHMLDHAEYYRLDEGHQEYLASKGDGFQAVENARLDFIAGVLVPVFDKHCEISKLEEHAVSELMGIYEKANGQPVNTEALRIAYLESVVDYVGQCRDALNSTGLRHLPEAPAPYKSTLNVELPEEKPDVAAQTKPGSSVSADKPSVLDEIREARSAPKAPAKPKPENVKDEKAKNGKKKDQTEL